MTYDIGGGVDREGNIYGMPSDAETILKIDTATGRVSTFGVVSDEHNKWQGKTRDRTFNSKTLKIF
jgi:hypothetical protein